MSKNWNVLLRKTKTTVRKWWETSKFNFQKSKWRWSWGKEKCKEKLGIPVVIMADLMAAGDQVGWSDLRRATMAEIWGVAMEVPVCMVKPPSFVMSNGEVATNIATPGAPISGCSILRFSKNNINIP